jgi:glycosyltransferase involved in cell wall biosynthesis
MEAASLAGLPLRLVCSPANLAGVAPAGAVEVRYDVAPALLRDEYAAAAAVAVPTHGDGFPDGSDCSGTLVLLDALAMGRPAVITARASVGDYITPGEQAMTVPPSDVRALATALTQLVEDGPLARRLAAAGRERVLAGLTTRHFATRLAEIFAEVTA